MALTRTHGVFLDGETHIEPYLKADDMTDYSHEFLEEMTTEHEEIMYAQYLKNHEKWVNSGGDWENTKLMDPKKFVNQVKKKVIRAWIDDVVDTDTPVREDADFETSSGTIVKRKESMAHFKARQREWQEELEALKEEAEEGIPPAINFIFQFYWTQAFIEPQSNRAPRLVSFCAWFNKLRRASAKQQYHLELKRQEKILAKENKRRGSANPVVRKAKIVEDNSRNEAFEHWIRKHRREHAGIYESARHIYKMSFKKTYLTYDHWSEFFKTDDPSGAKDMAKDWSLLFHPDRHRSSEFIAMADWLHEKTVIVNDFKSQIP